MGTLCEACLSILQVDAVAATVIIVPGLQPPVGCSDQRSRDLADLEMTLAQGPGREVAETRTEVWVPDLNAGHPTWPVFANEALRYGVRAVFAVPAGIRGVLVVYRESPGPLTAGQHRDQCVFASLGAELSAYNPGEPEWPIGGPPDHVQIYQASAIVAEQYGVHLDVALDLLRVYTFAHNRRLRDVARDVSDNILDLDITA